ncbi:MAG TPA: c-type cytochrome biogenesis protein CcsB [Bacteroidales bacterium]|nr:c-type cytochrome biogenesis protein CcsB [Bacteroidales bacterium]HOK73683.1 c-type cytochrome biogenesis protein CcsB [Bacteroidales bacterium]HPP91429.1 c-type cytochrome biogenesis protein CcsB [Bacteroidales bacterium]HRR15248.1 c-type cytochrome biogenesis protein CcsB [Bacteroidales bacterium]HRU55761.1 c-type cytochrome biogenesis protein CcsB [Bacteroidales bacterium]
MMKILRFLFSPVLMALLFFFFALAMAVATFIENDYGREMAYGVVYGTKWFELIMILLAVNLAGQVFQYRLWRKEKITIMGFHLAFIVMLAGAGLTRYTGYEGTIHIREGEEENRVFSAEKYLGYALKDEGGNIIAERYEKYSPALERGSFERKINENLVLRLAQVIPDAIESVEESPSGSPVVSFLVSLPNRGMQNLIIKEGESTIAGALSVSFNSDTEADVRITADSTGFWFTPALETSVTNMMGGDKITFRPGEKIPLKQMQVISAGDVKFVPQRFTLKGIISVEPAGMERIEEGKSAMIFHVFEGSNTYTVTLWNNPGEYVSEASTSIGGKTLSISFGSKIIKLPFSLKLNDFILERYPGSNTPSGYKSDVLLNDHEAGISKPYLIYMNRILKYRGYRFYQASYDSDERGTILSVNHDIVGMMVTYTGYGILFLFIILSLLNKNSLFRKANISYWHSPFSRKILAIAVFVVLCGFSSLEAQQRFIPDRRAADEFGKVLIQDQKGRTEPLYTLSNDILRKVAHKTSFEGLTSMQVLLGIYFDFQNWQNVPLIRISNRNLAKKIGLNGRMAAFSDIVDFKRDGNYKLSDDVERAYSKRPAERNKYDKEVIKTDERVNIVYMVYTGEFMKLFPLRDSLGSWGNAETAMKNAFSREDSLYVGSILSAFYQAASVGNISQAKLVTRSLLEYQRRFAGYKLPSDSKIKAELLFIKASVFEKLFPFYATTGIVALVILIIQLIRGQGDSRLINLLVFWLLFVGFIAHTTGIALRWYVSGHAPLSNGYESMIFISWVTLLAGFIFSRKSSFTLPATAVLSAMTLLVAHMSFMDPEITNLVPVLKSYWLTLHVSVITSSYAFLGLGAVLGLIVMILLIFSNEKNISTTGETIESLTVINYRTLIIGLYLLTIGTFLGAIWANESWGRYWGWDPKETWSLITIIVYSFVVHSRMMPSLKNIYAFNLLSVLAISSVLMTYFGVNYYLSGLHSYAGGDPVPVPAFVYLAIAVIVALAILSYAKYKKWEMPASPNE